MQEVVFGKSNLTENLYYSQLSRHHLEDSGFYACCACRFASLLPQKSASVRWKSCLLGYPCAIIIDDLLVWGEGTAHHDANLKRVLQRVQDISLKPAPKKWTFCLNPVSYVGHQFTNGGLKPDEAKVAAIKEMLTLDGPEVLHQFFGMTNYLHKFISIFSEKTAPLRKLLWNDTHWSWEPAEQQTLKA